MMTSNEGPSRVAGGRRRGARVAAVLVLASVLAAVVFVLLMNDDGRTDAEVDVTGMTSAAEIRNAVDSRFATAAEVIVIGSASLGADDPLIIHVPEGGLLIWKAVTVMADSLEIYGPGSFISAPEASFAVGAFVTDAGCAAILNGDLTLTQDGRCSGACSAPAGFHSRPCNHCSASVTQRSRSNPRLA